MVEERLFRTLEFNKVIQQLLDHSSSSLGREKIEQLRPTTQLDEAINRQKVTFEAYTVLRLKGSVPFGGIRILGQGIARAELGASLSTTELLDIAGTLYGGWRLRRTIESVIDEEQSLPMLEGLVVQIDA